MNEVIARKSYSVAEVAVMLGYGVTKTKFLVLSGQIRSVKDGGSRRILPEWAMTTSAGLSMGRQHEQAPERGSARSLPSGRGTPRTRVTTPDGERKRK